MWVAAIIFALFLEGWASVHRNDGMPSEELKLERPPLYAWTNERRRRRPNSETSSVDKHTRSRLFHLCEYIFRKRRVAND